jgi:hypothetical protein
MPKFAGDGVHVGCWILWPRCLLVRARHGPNMGSNLSRSGDHEHLLAEASGFVPSRGRLFRDDPVPIIFNELEHVSQNFLREAGVLT